MVSVTYKTLVNYIYDDNFDDFRAFLSSKRVLIDDKDEVMIVISHILTVSYICRWNFKPVINFI